jgi:hypothetical protein
MRHLIPISGKDSLTTALVQIAHEPNLPYEFFTNIVGKELPPFWDWLTAVEEALGHKITRIESDLKAIIASKGILPSPMVRYCTREAKIQPMEQYIGDDSAVVYYGLRADEEFRQGYNKDNHIVPKYPLREHGIDIFGVWTILEAKNLLPPAFVFPEVVEGVKAKMGQDFAITEQLRPWHYNQLFSGRTRQFNCYDCFYMRRYEFAYMYLHWSEYFYRAVEVEETTGAEDYSLIKDYPLRMFTETYEQVIEKRVDSVTRTLYRLAQLNIFEELPEELSLTSCGLFCGK